MRPQITIRQALDDPNLLGLALAGESWAGWRVLLIALMGEPLSDDERVIFQRLTGGRVREPGKRVEEATFVIGRRGGKSRAMSVLAAYLSCLCDHPRLVRGETGVLLCIAPDARQAKISLDYATACIEQSPLLRQLVTQRTADCLELNNGISLEVRSASFRRLRGPTYVAVIADEAAFWYSDEFSANADVEILNAVRPGLASTGGPLIVASSPYGEKGVLFETWSKHFGPQGDSQILVAQASSRDLNPSLSEDFVARAYERDAVSASSEFGARFRSDLETFLSRDAIMRCVQKGVIERLPERAFRYWAFTDPAGGSGTDSFTLAIAHKLGPRLAETVIVDKIVERRPPFNPEMIVSELADICLAYRCSWVSGDAYAGEWPRAAFKKFGVGYQVASKSRSELYLTLQPLVTARAVDLLDHTKMISQLSALERRVGRSGQDAINHPPGGHDDLANSVAGAIALAFAGASNTKQLNGQLKVILGYQKARRDHAAENYFAPQFGDRVPKIITGYQAARRAH